ncbi:MAG TPA: translation factor GTPase family protein [Gaiellaceae bacterium]|nr:translation factor GTPase family protein [Gaiellaceae bacterium]
MSRSSLNLGILAHVDAGKTSLTERLLFAAGVIDAVGRVDDGTTQTDSLDLERQRGITIKSAVVAFSIGELGVNLIDTPGHPDFIAEVERVLSVLDGAVLVISAVEGVQPQTLLLMRALKRLAIPTLLFVNKIDRAGADAERVLDEIRTRLTPSIIAMESTERIAEALAEHDDDLLAALVEGANVSAQHVRRALVDQVRRSLIHPVFFGSAMTGEGIDAIQQGIAQLLPPAEGDPSGPLAASVFKVERDGHGEKVAYVRMFSGTLHTRDRVRFADGDEAKVTLLRVFDEGEARQSPDVGAGRIAKVWGLGSIRIGDSVGAAPQAERQFAPPTLEAVVDPIHDDDRERMRAALMQLAEQDPLINIRQSDRLREIFVSLYGEVQQEVIEATLANDYGIGVRFRDTTPIYVERPSRAGRFLAEVRDEGNPFWAALGLSVEPTAPGHGIEFAVDVPTSSIPLFIYKTTANFTAVIGRHVREALQEGLCGWQVTDCRVTVTHCGWTVADGPPSRRGPTSTPNDYKRLVPVVVMRALSDSGTIVCEPMLDIRVDAPARSLGAVLAAVARLHGLAQTPSIEGDATVVTARLPAARAHELQRELAGLTHGEGALETTFGGYEPLGGEPPTRERTTPNPLKLDEYLMVIAKRVA